MSPPRRADGPPRSDDAQLEADRQRGIQRFIAWRRGEGTRQYANVAAENEALVEQLFKETGDLDRIADDLFVRAPELLKMARFIAGPPLSEDDLHTLADGNLSLRRPQPEIATRAAEVIAALRDPTRFPWLGEKRAATPSERMAAIRATVALATTERVRTLWRNESSARQQQSAREALRAAGFAEAPRVAKVDTLDQIPRGSFMQEVQLDGAKCDMPVRLRDGRLLALECKVSNSSLNSVKRLLRETGGKARAWHNAFGQTVLTGAVLAGVYKLMHLKEAQDDYDVAIFWEHDLAPLQEFVRSVR
ncbi:MAG: XamI family restriction endonuclease [Candidatus Limnocylindria bacterium]